ncbi:tetraspanin-32 isoform X4 [Dermochelys coriacea]|uniref:tetraspanin-32 isoform X4 n=1 Tax=Dermochelys coriacea TaxID=27794 RepID=UPI001CA86E1C|nr:tetraspanin-32 isoform X4 [Dermochelys coriacea]
MGRRHWVRTTKCQLLVTSLFVMLLGLAVTILTIITRYGAHFSVISGVSPEANPYRIFHNVAFYSGICLSMILVLAALLSTVATVRESVCLMAMGFFCFAIVFCALIQAAFWRYTNNSETNTAATLKLVKMISQQRGRGDSHWEEWNCTPAEWAEVSALAERQKKRTDEEPRCSGRYWSVIWKNSRQRRNCQASALMSAQ